jgi:phage terminase large subunit
VSQQILNYQIPKIKVALESYQAYKAGYRIIANQGGTRSGKTYTINQLLIALALKEKLTISVTSVAFPHLRRGAMRDWRTIMENSGLYDPMAHVRTEQVYNYPNGSYTEFFSSDNNLKVRGPGRDILFFNEANLTDFDTFTQLMLRTRKAIFIDFNPADEFHWIYDSILTRPDCYFIKSTYLDNPFLPIEQVKEIENLKNVDENFWRIYGEGERGHSEGVIYTHWKPYSVQIDGRVSFGLDFGYNNPTSLVKVTEKDQNLYWEEKIYQSHLTNSDLIPMIKQIVKPHETIYADSAEPARIEELKRAGIKAVPANKDVKEGIDFVKGRGLFVHSQSVNLLKEIKSYKFASNLKKNKNEPEVPVKLNDHAMDAGRYGSISMKKPKTGLNVSFHRACERKPRPPVSLAYLP